jgi:hypothetical protein
MLTPDRLDEQTHTAQYVVKVARETAPQAAVWCVRRGAPVPCACDCLAMTPLCARLGTVDLTVLLCLVLVNVSAVFLA